MNKKCSRKSTKKPANPVGRPPLYKTPDALQKKIDQYFKNGFRTKPVVSKDGTVFQMPVVTISGLVIYLGFCDRHSFYDVGKKPEFSHTIKRARTFIEREYEELLRLGNCTGAIFALKNFGWQDKVDVEHSGDLIINYGHRKKVNA